MNDLSGLLEARREVEQRKSLGGSQKDIQLPQPLKVFVGGAGRLKRCPREIGKGDLSIKPTVTVLLLLDERRIFMKVLTRVLTFVFVASAVIALAGCGASKEDYDKAVSELSKTKAELAQATTKMAEMEKSLSEAQAKLKSQAMQPTPAEKPAAVEQPAAVDTGMQNNLAAAQKEAADLRAKVDSLTGENADLKGMLEKLKAEYAEIQKKLGGAVPAPTQQVPAGLPKKP